MSTRTELMALGIAAAPARGLGMDAIQAIVPAGTTQGGATVITSPLCNAAATSANTGVLLPVAENKPAYVVRNGDGANALKVYPNGTAQINAGGASVAFSIAASKSAVFFSDGTNWLAVLSA